MKTSIRPSICGVNKWQQITSTHEALLVVSGMIGMPIPNPSTETQTLIQIQAQAQTLTLTPTLTENSFFANNRFIYEHKTTPKGPRHVSPRL
jgi:hypothetical protein